MGKAEALSLITAAEKPRPSTALQIFREATKLLWRGRKPMLAILLILLLPQALVVLGLYLFVTPLTKDMLIKSFTLKTKHRTSPAYHELLTAVMNDLRELTGAQLAVLLISFLSSAFLVMAVVQTVSMAGKGEQATLSGLLCRIRRTWKGPMATQLYVVVISFGYMGLLLLTIGAFAFISSGSIPVLALACVAAIFALLLLVYLRMVWLQGLVVSVVEEGCYGLEALGRAAALIRGRRRLGFNVSLLLLLLAKTLYVVYYLVNTRLPAGGTSHLAGGLLVACTGLLMSAFTLAVDVVFYCECKRNHGEETAMEGSLVYCRVPTLPTGDVAVP
ncbi:hypothetical protein Taro_003653 [Colocasia esculenta]|uniref:Uncharacterized protein n=1 Tax=Colocasia esculenta TaxID=4460 RepID=A0A843TG35_COLES|nr:hypothetical protein [Colocasia esculenta]